MLMPHCKETKENSGICEDAVSDIIGKERGSICEGPGHGEKEPSLFSVLC